MRIDRCYCFQRTFAELKAIAQQRKVTSLEGLQQQVAFGLRCRLCLPYVRHMLQTGKTVFHEVLREDVA